MEVAELRKANKAATSRITYYFRTSRITSRTTVEVCANPAWVGTEQTRVFQISGDRLQEMTAWAARPDNRMARAVITYERAK